MVKSFSEQKNHLCICNDEANNYQFMVARTRNQRTNDTRIYAIPCLEVERVVAEREENKSIIAFLERVHLDPTIEEAYLLTQGWRDLCEAKAALLKYGGVLVRTVSSKPVLEDLTRSLIEGNK
ncbi:MAG: hypothetical protein WC796_03825 [Candidatus Pacearchaeota archaeon]|jgi:hypothetical protein